MHTRIIFRLNELVKQLGQVVHFCESESLLPFRFYPVLAIGRIANNLKNVISIGDHLRLSCLSLLVDVIGFANTWFKVFFALLLLFLV